MYLRDGSERRAPTQSTEAAYPVCCPSRSQYTDTEPTSLSTDLMMLGAEQGSY